MFHQLAEDLLATRLDGGSQHERHQGDRPEESVLDLVRRANRSYLAGYRGRAKLMGIVEQVAMFDPEIRRIRQERSDAFTTRTISNIRLLQKAGLASPDIDPAYASIALTSMVSRFAYVWLVDGPDLGMALEFDEVVESLSVLWVQALGVARDAVAPPRTAR